MNTGKRDKPKRYRYRPWQRALALLLVVLMTITLTPYDMLATEGVSAAQTEELQAQALEGTSPETGAPETGAPETKAPETKAPETKAPETKAPETGAPETKAPETSAPETKAPETGAPETKAPETSAPETKAPETSAPETKAPETSAPETKAPETKAPETKASETGAPQTNAPETTPPQTNAPETVPSQTDAPETMPPQTDAPETVPSQTEEVTEKETEKPETEEKQAELSASARQEVFAEADGSLAVKYTVKVRNHTSGTDAREVAVKAVLGENLSVYTKEGQTQGIGYIEDIRQIPQGLDLDELAAYTAQQLEPYQSAVLWLNETIPGGAEKEYVFFAYVGDGAQNHTELPALFFADGERIADRKTEWKNTELIEAVRKEEAESENESETSGQEDADKETEADGGAQGAAVTKIRVTGEKVNLRKGPGTDTEIAGSALKDTVFEVLGTETDAEGYLWYLISVDGQQCFIRSDFTEVAETAQTEQTEETAAQTEVIEYIEASASQIELAEQPETGDEAAKKKAAKDGEMTLDEYINTYVKDQDKVNEYIQVNAVLDANDDKLIPVGEEFDVKMSYSFSSFPVFDFGAGNHVSPVRMLEDASLYIGFPTAADGSDMIQVTETAGHLTRVGYEYDNPNNPMDSGGGQYPKIALWYKWELGDVEISGSTNKTIGGIRIRFLNNGSVADALQYTIPTQNVRLAGKIAVTDFTDPSDPEEKCRQEVAPNMPNDLSVWTQAENNWDIRKTLQSKDGVDWELTEDGSKVAVTYKIETGKPITKDGAVTGIDGDGGAYNVYGTLNFDSYAVTDTIPDFVAEGNDTDRVQATGPVTVTWADAAKTPLSVSEYTYNENTKELCITAYKKLGGAATMASAETPVYSSYLVTAYYPYKELEKHFSEVPVLYKQTNTATLTYRLKTTSVDKVRTSSDSAKFTKRNEPVQLKIRKSVLNTADNSTFYYDTTGPDAYGVAGEKFWELFPGYVGFELYKDNNGQPGEPADVYYAEPKADTSYEKYEAADLYLNPYAELKDGSRTVNLGTDGTLTVALDPGTYWVKETESPEGMELRNDGWKKVTVSEDAGVPTVVLENQLAGTGTLRFTKVGGNQNANTPMNGVHFGLFSSRAEAEKENGTPDYEAVSRRVSGSDGQVVFSVRPDTYYLKELTTVSGYKPDNTIYKIVIREDETTTLPPDGGLVIADNKLLNYSQHGSLVFKKYIIELDKDGNKSNTSVTNKLARDSMKFKIERSVDNTNWNTVEEDITISYLSGNSGDTGFVRSDLPVEDADGNPYTYRVVETERASGYFPENYDNAKLTTECKPLVAGGTTEFEMKNMKQGSFRFQKKDYSVDTPNGANAPEGITFTLYQENADEQLEQVTDGERKTNSSGILYSGDLNMVDGSGKPIKYYVEEQERPGFAVKEDESTPGYGEKELAEGGKVNVFGPFYAYSDPNAMHYTIANQKLTGKIAVKKVDGDTKAAVSGAKFKIYKLDENGNRGTEAVDTLTSTGNLSQPVKSVELEPGTYHVVEVTPPTDYNGYVNAEISDADAAEYGGRNYQVAEIKAGGMTEVVTLEYDNYRKPELNLEKKVVTNAGIVSGTELYTEVDFELYSENGGNLKKVQDGTITAGQVTKLYLDPGTYYVKETDITQKQTDGSLQVLLPEDVPGYYTNVGNAVNKNGVIYFGPFEVKPRAEGVTYQTQQIRNFQNRGALQVTKTDSVSGKALAGAKFTLSCIDTDGNRKEYTGRTDGTGVCRWDSLPILDSKGKTLVYTLTETKAPDGYALPENPVIRNDITLKPLGTIGAGGKFVEGESVPVSVTNKPLMSLTAFKVGQDLWWTEANPNDTQVVAQEMLKGVKLALYKVDGDSAKYVETQVTDEYGRVNYQNLVSDGTYYVVEIGTNEFYPDLPDGKTELANAAAMIPVSQITEYNHLKVTFGNGAVTGATRNGTDISQDVVQNGYEVTISEELENTRPWARFEIIKKDADTGVLLNEAYFNGYNLGSDIGKILDKEMLYEDPRNQGTYLPNPETLFGSRVTETIAGGEGHAFTNPIRFGDVIVIKETQPPVGYLPSEESRGILLVPKGRFTAEQIDQVKTLLGITNVVPYEQNTTTPVVFRNEKLIPGPGVVYDHYHRLVQVEVKKLLDGKPLSGVTFGLYLYDETDHSTPYPLGEMTTGISGEAVQAGYALSAPVDFENYFQILSANDAYRDRFSTVTEDFGELEPIVSDHGSYVRTKTVTETFDGLLTRITTTKEYYTKDAVTDPVPVTTRDYTYRATIALKEEKVPEGVIQSDQLYLVEAETRSDENLVLTLDKYEKDPISNVSTPDYTVTLTKYGYQRKDGLNYAAAADKDGLDEDQWLDQKVASDNKKPLDGVTFRLEKQTEDGMNWETVPNRATGRQLWDTNDYGMITFTGLKEGMYRLSEESLGKHEGMYENTHSWKDHYVFKIVHESVSINLYNPEKPQLMVRKFDRADLAVNKAELSGTVFTITNTPTGTVNPTAGDFYDASGNIQPIYIERDKDIEIKETTPAQGYTTKYVTTTRTVRAAWSGADGQTWLEDNLITVDFLNAKKGSITVTKKEEGTDKPLAGAKFTLSRMDFRSDDAQTVSRDQLTGGEYLADADLQILKENLTAPEANDTGWQPWGSEQTTDANRLIAWDDLDPGWYKVTETAAPSGYEITQKDTIVLVKGSFGKLGNLGAAAVNNADYNSTVTITNKPYGKLEITKKFQHDDKFTFGQYPAVKFGIYRDTACTVRAAEITIPAGTDPGTQTELSRSVLLPEGTYYVKEESPEAEGWAIKDSGYLEKGYFTAQVSKGHDSIVTVDAENWNIRTRITILKVPEGAQNADNGLAGAKFKLFYKTTDGEGQVTEHFITDVDGKEEFTSGADGTVTVEFLYPQALLTADTWNSGAGGGQLFYIRETEAPDTYARDETDHEIRLWPNEERTYSFDAGSANKELIFFDKQGVKLSVTKWDNIHANKGKPGTDTQSEVRFDLYEVSGAAGSETFRKIDNPQTVTDANGNIVFDNLLFDSTKEYGLVEVIGQDTQLDKFYTGLESVWLQNADGTEMELQSRQYTIDGKRVTMFMLNKFKVGESYTYHAYNEPKVRVFLYKWDETNPSEVVQSTFRIYRSADGKTHEAAPMELWYSNDTTDTVYTKHGTDLTTGTGEIENRTALAVRLSPGWYYVEEISTDADYFLNTWDSRIVTERYFEITDADVASGEDIELTFHNSKEVPDVTIGKRSAEGAVKKSLNLLKESGTVTFEIGGSVKDGTAQPWEIKNFLPLTDFTLNDTGAYLYTAEDGTSVPLPDGSYSIQTVRIGAASYQNYMKDFGGTENGEKKDSVTAEVAFYGFDSALVGSATVSLAGLAAGAKQEIKVAEHVPAGTKVKSFTVTYYDPDLQNITFDTEAGQTFSRALGQNFTAEPVTVTLELFQQEEGPEVYPAKLVRNRAEVSMQYFRPSNKRSSAQENLPTESNPIIKRTEAEQILDPQFAIPKVSIEQTIDKTTVEIGEKITYTIKIVNHEEAGGPVMKLPIVTDQLPDYVDLTTLGITTDYYKITSNKGKEWKLIEGEQMQTEVDGKAYLNFWLNQNLEPGEELTIEFSVKVLPEIVEGNLKLINDAYLTSQVKETVWGGNPLGASFEPYIGPGASGGDIENFENLDTALGLEATEELGYLRTETAASILAQSTFSRTKQIVADKDEGYWPDTYLPSGVAARASAGGKVKYRLTLMNGEDVQTTEVRIADVFPAVNDIRAAKGEARHSMWTPVFEKIIEITLYDRTVGEDGVVTDTAERTLTEGTDYTVYTTTAPITTTAEGQAEQQRLLAWLGTETPEGPPAGWSRGAAGGATAIIIDFSENVVIGNMDSIVAEYQMDVPKYSQEEVEALAGLAATNDFATSTWTMRGGAATVLDSAPVNVLIEGDNVGVGGDVWIDENRDGIQNDKKLVTDVDDVPGVKVELATFYGNQEFGERKVLNPEQNTLDTAAVMKHFQFGDLPYSVPIAPDNLEALYDENTGALIPSKLSGNKINYQLIITPPEGYELTGAFVKNNGLQTPSENPRVITNGADCNFTKQGDSYVSERFYLWPVFELWDMSKDIGLTKTRDLSITKEEEGSPQTKLEDAEFSIYGPFEPDAQDADITLTAQNLAGTLTTGADGTAVYKGLNYYKDYVLVETDASAGYDKDSAKITGVTKTTFASSGAAGNAEVSGWRLKAMGKDELVYTVTNRYATGKLTIQKRSSGNNEALAGAEFTLNYSGADALGKSKWQQYGEALAAAQATWASMGIADVTYTEAEGLAFTLDGTQTAAGTAVFDGIPLGSYVLTETKAPEHYEITQTVYPITVTEDAGGTGTIQTVTNDPLLQLTIEKAADQTVTTDRKFHFYVEIDGKAYQGKYTIDEGTTEYDVTDGKLSIEAGHKAVIKGLDPDTDYSVEETDQNRNSYKPEITGQTGDTVDAANYKVSGTVGTGNAVLRFNNILKTGAVQVTKTLAGTPDPDEAAPVFDFTLAFEKAEGAKLFDTTLQPDTDNLDVAITSTSGGSRNAKAVYDAADGKYHLNGLGHGETAAIAGIYYGVTVTLDEVERDDGYVYDTRTPSAIIGETVPTFSADFSNAVPGGLKIIKRDRMDTERVLPGAKFTLQRKAEKDPNNGKYVVFIETSDGIYTAEAGYADAPITPAGPDERTTTLESSDLRGSITITGLELGEYTLTETKAPNGYEIEGTGTQTVKVDSQNPTAVYDVYNTPNTGGFRIVKALAGNAEADPNQEFEFVIKLAHDAQSVIAEKRGDTEKTAIKVTKKKAGAADEVLTLPLQADGYHVTMTALETVEVTGIYYNETYSLKENADSATGYIYDGKVQNGTITTETVSNVTFTNTRPGSLTFEKVNAKETDEKLGGAEFVIRNAAGAYVTFAQRTQGRAYVYNGTAVSQSTAGKIVTEAGTDVTVTNLPAGDYTLVETKAPENYTIVQAETPFTITTNQMTNLTVAENAAVTNEPLTGEFRFRKALEGNLTADAGDKFTFAFTLSEGIESVLPDRRDGANIKVQVVHNGVTTDITKEVAVYKDGEFFIEIEANDRVIVDHVYYGTDVSVREVEDLTTGYIYDTTPRTGTVDANTPELRLSAFVNKVPGDFVVEKVDAEDSSIKLEGAEFVLEVMEGVHQGKLVKVTGQNGTYTFDGYTTVDSEAVFVTGADGKASVQDITQGKYLLKEQKAPADYEILDTTGIEITITADAAGTAVSRRVDNAPKLGTLTMKKTLTDDVENANETFEFRFRLTDMDPAGTQSGPMAVVPEYRALNGIEAVRTNADGSESEITAVYDAANDWFSVSLKAKEQVRIEGIYYGTGYSVWEVQGREDSGFTYDTTPKNDSITDDAAKDAEVTIVNTAPGSLKLVKVDEEDPTKQIADAKFVLLKGTKYVKLKAVAGTGRNFSYQGLADSEEQATVITTNADGGVFIHNLPAGADYQLKEIEAPYPYKIKTEMTSVTVTTGQQADVTVENSWQEAASVQFRAVKQIQNTDTLAFYEVPDEAFTFKLYEADADWKTETDPIQTKKNSSEEVVFDEIIKRESEIGDYYYVIREEADPDDPILTYDGTEYRIHVKIDWTDASKTALKADVTVEDAEGTPYDADDITFVNTLTKETELTMSKVDSSNAALPGVEFTLTNDADPDDVQVMTSDEDGKITFTGLIEGVYTLKETHTLDEYRVVTDEWQIKVLDTDKDGNRFAYDADLWIEIRRNAEGDPAAELTVVNTLKDKTFIQLQAVKALKSDGSGTAYKVPDGAFTFELYELKDGKETKLQEAVNDAAGMVTFAPVEYDEDVEGESFEYLIREKDDSGKEALKGILFDKQEYRVQVTVLRDADGVLTTEPKLYNEKSGTYDTAYAKEKAAFLNKIKEKEAAFEFLKTDGDGKALAGAEFTLTGTKGQSEKKAVSDAAGKVRFDGLQAGSYILTETKAPDGYVKSDLKWNVEVTDTDQHSAPLKVTILSAGKEVKELKVVNQITSVKFIKTDEDGKGLAGATLQILDEQGNVLDDWVTDGKEKTITGLTAGVTYILSEKKAPEGYLLAEDVRFTVSAAETVKVTMVDEEEPETETETEPPSKPPVTPPSKPPVKTGDDTPVEWYLLILALSAAVLGVTGYRRKKSR